MPARAPDDDVRILSARISAYEIVESPDGLLGPKQRVHYVIHIRRSHHSHDIRHTFTEFKVLNDYLTNSGLGLSCSLPRKTVFRCFANDHLAERVKALNTYLEALCKRPELHRIKEVSNFFEPQLKPEWGDSGEAAKSGFFGSLCDISKGGKRSKDTFMTVLELTKLHKQFKKDIAEMLEQEAPDEEMHAKSSAYLTNMAERVRDMMLRNGGFQVKMGQAISAQKAMLPREITETLSACCDKANSLPLSAIRTQVTSVLGRPMEEVFSYISEEPLAAASIAQVHRARLRGSGEEVVMKVVHPGVADSMRADAAFMPYLIKLVERVEQNHGLHPLAVTMESMLKQELDMRREGQNRERLAAVVERSARSARSLHCSVSFPKVFWEHCREGLMVQEFAAGAVALTSQAAVEALGVPFQLAVAELAELFGETAFIHGYLHNDLHPGNVLVRPASSSRSCPQMRRLTVLGSLSAMYLSFATAFGLLMCFIFSTLPLQIWLSVICCIVVFTSSTIFGAKAPEKNGLPGWLGGLPSWFLVLAANGYGLHCRLRGLAERLVSRAFNERFELIIIDHGFHTHLPFDFRLTWCKVWAACGLGDERLLKEAADELNLDDDEYKVLPLVLCFLPYPVWKKHEFPNPADLIEMLKDEDVGLPRCKAMDKKMPHLWHLVMRVNGQVSALFQMQYGVTPACRYEFMRFMTRSALMGLRFRQRPLGDGMPVPDCLLTADREFFERELPAVEREMRSQFRWNQTMISEKWEPNANFLKSLKKNIESGDADGKSGEG